MKTARKLLRGLAYGTGGVAALALLYGAALRPWHLRWGSTEEEEASALPGDELVPHPTLQSTRAITIGAPPAAVWPWLVQLGQGRGGFYSHTWVQNLLRSDIHNADRILPELQDLAVGDTVWLASPGNLGEGAPHFTVARLEPNRALVLHADVPPEAAYAATWSFVLVARPDGATRLVVRFRAWSDPPWLAPILGVEPIHFVMERQMLRGIKARAEPRAS